MSHHLIPAFIFLSTPSSQRATSAHCSAIRCPNYFYPRPLRRGRRMWCLRPSRAQDFYPRPLRRGRRFSSSPFTMRITISIHALFAEGDRGVGRLNVIIPYFYPRPLRRGRHLSGDFPYLSGEFLSTPSSQRATMHQVGCLILHRFLSTPSSQRATCGGQPVRGSPGISIHALFAEGDGLGGSQDLFVPISIHALFAEGDKAAGPPAPVGTIFLSTPSSQRATRG